MTPSNATVSAQVQNERDVAGKGRYRVRFDLTRDLHVTFPGPTGPHPIGPVESDLLDVALGIFFVERDLRRPAKTNRIRSIGVRLPVRDPDRWRPVALILERLLGFMGGYGWSVSFSESDRPPHRSLSATDEEKAAIALHSGGVDGTCGLGWLRERAASTQLGSFYTSQRRQQEQIANELGFGKPSGLRAVWRTKASHRGRGGFAYRSFLFLSFGTALARSFGAETLYQFENGFLAAAIPPAPSYFPTRHAHPRYHRLFMELIAGLGIDVQVENPFRWLTKRQAVEQFRRAYADLDADAVLARTQSCWFFNYHQFPSRFESERIRLGPSEHCGACVPCLVRRTALGDSAYSLDPRSPPVSVKDPRNVSYNYDAYRVFSEMVITHGTMPATLRRALLARGIVVDRETGPWKQLHPLIVRFANEFLETFR